MDAAPAEVEVLGAGEAETVGVAAAGELKR